MYGRDYETYPAGREGRIVPARPRSPVSARHRARGKFMAEFDALYLGSVSVPFAVLRDDIDAPGVLADYTKSVMASLMDRMQGLLNAGTRMRTYVLRIFTEHISFNPVESRDVQHIPISMIDVIIPDPLYPSIFSLVARGKANRYLCHVFECRSVGQCNAIVSTMKSAFAANHETWLKSQEVQEQDPGDYFQEWDGHAARGAPLYNVTGLYNSSRPRAQRSIQRRREDLGQREERGLPDRLIVTRNQSGGHNDFTPEPYTLRFDFDNDDYEPQEEVYVRQDLYGRRNARQYWD